jgi:hypothetical protein
MENRTIASRSSIFDERSEGTIVYDDLSRFLQENFTPTNDPNPSKAGNLNMNSNIINLAIPQSGDDAVNKTFLTTSISTATADVHKFIIFNYCKCIINNI